MDIPIRSGLRFIGARSDPEVEHPGVHVFDPLSADAGCGSRDPQANSSITWPRASAVIEAAGAVLDEVLVGLLHPAIVLDGWAGDVPPGCRLGQAPVAVHGTGLVKTGHFPREAGKH
jgi:hypothetical protein